MDINYDGDLSKTRTCFRKTRPGKNSQVKYTVSYLFSRVHFMVTHPLLVEG